MRSSLILSEVSCDERFELPAGECERCKRRWGHVVPAQRGALASHELMWNRTLRIDVFVGVPR